MLEELLVTSGSILLCLVGLFFLGVVAVIIYVLIFVKANKVKLPEGVIEIRSNEYPDSRRYLNEGKPQLIDLAIAKKHTSELVHKMLEREFGFNPVGYFFGSIPTELETVNSAGMVYIITQAGYEKGLRGENIDDPRTHMNIHKDAVSGKA